MRTMFGKMLSLTVALILVSCLLLGCAFRIEMRRYLIQEKQEMLYNDAAAVTALAAAYNTAGELEDNWDFRISLSLAADVSEAQTLICDDSGTIVLSSGAEDGFIGKSVPITALAAAQSDGWYHERGTMNGLFADTKLIMCMPIVAESSGEQIGTVVVASEEVQIDSFLSHTTNIFLITALVTLAVAILVTSVTANRLTRPLKELARTARDFGHGNLHARAAIGADSTEEMDELTTAFNNMATSLEKSELQRRELVANVSHELKTPMTTIAGFMDGMLDGTIPEEQHRKYMQTVSDEVRRLSRLVRSMLEISRIQDQGIPEERKQKFDICESIGRVLLTFEQKINAKHLQVEVQMPDNGVRVYAEPDAITQVIYNLTDNAVKFCSEGGSLYLQVESDGSKATVSVANTGETIPAEELPLVFDRFHKADRSRSKDREGAGLGLYIVKTIVVSHGEDISVTSRDGVTRFSFTLPVK